MTSFFKKVYIDTVKFILLTCFFFISITFISIPNLVFRDKLRICYAYNASLNLRYEQNIF